MEPKWHERQLFFLHIHKTAGTSFINLLDQCYTTNEVCPSDWPYRQRLHEVNDEELLHSKFIRGHFSYDGVMGRVSSDPVCMIFLRDPVTRFISHFEHLKRSEGDPPGIHEQIVHLSLDEFVENEPLAVTIANMGARLLCGFEPHQQANRLDLAVAKDRLASFDFIGLTEEYEKSLFLFHRTYDLPEFKYLHFENVSPERDNRSTISQATLARIAALNQADIDIYNFGKQVFDRRVESAAQIKPRYPREISSRYESDFSYVDPGQGWFIGESHPKFGVIRWSGPETTSYIDLPALLEQDYAIRFRVVNALHPEQLEGLSLEVNGHSVPVTRRAGNSPSAGIFEGILPKSYLAPQGEPNLLGFRIAKTIRPCDIHPGSDDIRQLGLCYNWLRIVPLAGNG